jgi:hypothetical protein
VVKVSEGGGSERERLYESLGGSKTSLVCNLSGGVTKVSALFDARRHFVSNWRALWLATLP